MERLVDSGMVETTVDPVDEEVGEKEEEGELDVVVQGKGCLSSSIVKSCIAPYLGGEEGAGQDSHYGHRRQSLLHLESNLVLQEFGVLEGVVIEYEEIGEGGKYVVDYQPEEPAHQISRNVRLLGIVKFTMLSGTNS